jgi:hypothetical protein
MEVHLRCRAAQQGTHIPAPEHSKKQSSEDSVFRGFFVCFGLSATELLKNFLVEKRELKNIACTGADFDEACRVSRSRCRKECRANLHAG